MIGAEKKPLQKKQATGLYLFAGFSANLPGHEFTKQADAPLLVVKLIAMSNFCVNLLLQQEGMQSSNWLYL